jgi:ketosteroid isomerase-like protein
MPRVGYPLEAMTMRTFALTCFLLLACTAFAGDSGQQLDARAEINRAQAAYRAALLDSDVAMLAKIWTDDYTFTNGRGIFLTKDDRLKNIETGATELKSVAETGREVRLYGGDTAIITGKVTLKAKYSGQAGSGDYRYINVWVNRGDRWQMAANQITPIVE